MSEILPSVFRPKTGLVRFWEEVSKTHRYLLLFTASGEDGDKKRMLTAIHLLTVQTMLMFILAVFYDLQVSFIVFFFIVCNFYLISFNFI